VGKVLEAKKDAREFMDNCFVSLATLATSTSSLDSRLRFMVQVSSV